MDGTKEESVPVNGSTLEQDNLTTYIDELVTSQPIINVEKEVEHLRKIDTTLVEEVNKQATEDLKVMEEQCHTNSTIENVNQGEEVTEKEQTMKEVNKLIQEDGEKTVTTQMENEKVEHIEEIVLQNEEEKKGQVKVVNDGEKISEEKVTGNEDDGREKSENEPEMKTVTENEDGGEKKSENGPEIKSGNTKDDETKEEIKNTETVKINAKKRNRRGKKKSTTFPTTNPKGEVKRKRRRGKKKITLASTNANDLKIGDQGEPSCKNKNADEACIVADKNNMEDGESSGKKRKRTDINIANNANKGESSIKNNKKVDTMGMIFMCSSKTKSDCYKYKVFGLPAAKKDIVLKIYKGMRLFLFDFDLKLLYGIYKAAEPGGYDIEPKAFKSAFPSQVRFEVFKDCLPVAEEKFKNVIKDNYYSKNKFNCQLSPDQVTNLCKLFEAGVQGPKSQQITGGPPKQINKGPKSKQIDKGPDFRRVDRNPRAQSPVDRDRNRQKGKKPKDRENERRPGPASVREHSRRDRKRKDREQERPRSAYQDQRKDRKMSDREQERQLVPVHDPLYYSHAPPLHMPYAYSRPLQTEVYQRAPYLEDHDRERERERRPIDLPVFHDRERERRPIDLPVLRRQDELPRIDPIFPHIDRRPLDYESGHRGEVDRHSRYDSYQARSSLYRDPLYSSSSSQQPEYYSLAGSRQQPPPVEYHLPSSRLPSDSHVSSALPSDYSSRRLYYRY